MKYTIQFYINPYSYPDYGSVTPEGEPFEVTGVDINDNAGVLRTDRLTYAQRFLVNYLKITRDGVILWANITNMDRVSGDNLMDIHFKVDAFRTFRSVITIGEQFVVRQPGATYDYDPMLRGDSGETNIVTTTKYTLDYPNQRILVIQLMREDGNTTSYTSPVQPSPYILYFKQYDMSSSTVDADIDLLMKAITNSARPSNLASIYSVPVFGLGAGMSLTTGSIPLIIDGVTTNIGTSFFRLTGGTWQGGLTKYSDEIIVNKSILKTRHAVSLVIPEAGIINIPDEILFKPGLRLQQDIDIYSGASNFMLVYTGVEASPHSARGGGVSPIPIAYDAQQQLLAVNRSNIGSSIMGDVASIGIGIAGIASAGATGGLGFPAGIAGASMVAKGAMGLFSTRGAIGDNVNQQVNPPSFLGSAMTLNYNQTAYLVITQGRQDNATTVNARYGYQTDQIQNVTIPSSGFIQLQDSSVQGNIPTWARDEIDNLLNNGLRVK